MTDQTLTDEQARQFANRQPHEYVDVPPAWQDKYGTDRLWMGNVEHRHVAVEVTHPQLGDRLVFCHASIASLIAELMAAGLTTFESCEDFAGRGRVIVAFATKKPRWVLARRLHLAAQKWQRRPLTMDGWKWDVIRGSAIWTFPGEDVGGVVELLRLYRDQLEPTTTEAAVR